MANDCKDILLNREGTAQTQRFIAALQPENLKLQDFTEEDWILFAYSFAQHVNFFEKLNPEVAVGDWQGLFNHFGIAGDLPRRGSFEYTMLKKTVNEALAAQEKDNKLTPHLTLFICFIRLLELSQNRFNRLSKRHLDFYYKEILKIEKQLPEPDKAHIIFELAKRIDDYKIDEDTSLNAGKDPDGNSMVFNTLREIVVNKAKVTSLKSILNSGDTKELKAAPKVNSYDGQGAEFPEEAVFWHPFGYTSAQDELPVLPDASVGFSVASPMLALQSGDRNISIRFTFDDEVDFAAFDPEEITDLFSLYYTGDKKWEGPYRADLEANFFNASGEATTIIRTELDENSLTLIYKLDQDQAPVVAYDQELHLDPYDTDYPIAKLLIDTSTTRGYELFRNLINKPLKEIEIKVSVEGVQDIIIESDTGTLNANKPFYPFSTQPKENSNFFIDYPEAFSKNWKAFNVELLWKDAPDSFIAHYWAYKEEEAPAALLRAQEKAEFRTHRTLLNKGAANQPMDGLTKAADDDDGDDTSPPTRIIGSEDYFTADAFIREKEIWVEDEEDIQLFIREAELTKSYINLYNERYTLDRKGPIKLTLNQSFLHELFARLYALALTKVTIVEEDVPLAAYTPLAEAIALSYSANERTNFNLDTEDAYDNARIKLFHNTPYGLNEEHSTLKARSKAAGILKTTDSDRSYLLPDFCLGGELYIGLEEAQADQTVSLLFQILEGSENPQAESFTGNQKIQWFALCNNHWKDITDDIDHNQIDNMLQSGIVSFPLPKQATDDNSLLPADQIWLKAKIHKTYDAVCKVIDVLAQAVTAEFTDNDNNLAHLDAGLSAGTIGKLITRVPQIKSVAQPYNSFDHKPLEQDAAFYKRVSERLRHKNRAITIWDYEHIVLQAFPEVFKVLCLKHTKGSDNLVPGEVTLVVIPDIVNKNVFDIYQPRVSTATLNKITAHVNALNSLHVEASVINPEYETVTVSLGVKFYKGFDKNYYKKEINTDITKFLSPWAFDSTKNIAFGTALHNSVLIDYLEELPYVDYLENVVFIDEDNNEFTSVSPTKPGAILVSAIDHIIGDVTEQCTIEVTKPLETCKY
ncbi:MAG: baseplate J/gp47 family protein [Gilvibacter sp.]